MQQPLKGITVIALEHAIAAPFASRQLADLGARVIKVERLDGDFARDYDQRARGWSSHFVWANRGKQSLAANLKNPFVLEALKHLLKTADVFIQNLAPQAAQRMGLDYEALVKINPKIIVCDISGYGFGGPYQDQKAYDLLIQAQSGFLSVTGTEQEVVKAGPSIADIAAGMYGYSQILAALLQRHQTGCGQHIDISMLEAMMEWMGYPMYYSMDGQTPPPRNGASHATIFPYGTFKTADNDWLLLGLQNPREWRAFCLEVIQNPSLADDADLYQNVNRVKAKPSLEPYLRNCLKALSTKTLQARLDKAGIANAKVNQMKDLWAHPQLKSRNRWVDITLGQRVSVPSWLPPGHWDQADFAGKNVPDKGENSIEVLIEAGLQSSQIEALIVAGEVYQSSQANQEERQHVAG